MPAIKLREFVCPGCGKREMRKARQSTLYCTRQCWLENRAGKYLRTGKNVDCPTCGKSHYLRGAYIKIGRRYCSSECEQAPRAVKERPCKFCGTVFKPRGSINVYCSMSCRNSGIGIEKQGVRNVNWRGGSTKRMAGTAAGRAWTLAVFRRDDFTCAICARRGDKLEAHHKDGHHWCNERRFDVSNGVTLCVTCHKRFHSLYGHRNNTEKQWANFARMELTRVQRVMFAA